VARKVLDPYGIISYSQAAEDRIIAATLHDQTTGYYVDVGCHHPKKFSNTFHLYQRGWTGLNIDANQELIRQFDKQRPLDTNVCAVVSDQDAEVVFTEFAEPLVSSIDQAHIAEWRKSTPIKRQRLVRTVTLNALLQASRVPNAFDLLSIDVEGHDLEVLRSLDLTAYRPKVIVIEMHHLDLSELGSNKIYQHLSRHDYKMIGYAVMSGYFLDSRR
jgi:FkbM family methyltransferase